MPTLFEFAGGEPACLALAAAHHARCLADPELNHPFSHPGQHPQHVERLAAYWAEVLGGPPHYSRDCSDQSGMQRMHAGNGDMGDLGRRFLSCFVAAADDAYLPTDPAPHWDWDWDWDGLVGSGPGATGDVQHLAGDEPGAR